MTGSLYPKFRNDHAAPEIRIGAKEFNCIGVSPPHDHPHIYLNMREEGTIICPYCATLFRFDPQMGPFEVEPPDSLFVPGDDAEKGPASEGPEPYLRGMVPRRRTLP